MKPYIFLLFISLFISGKSIAQTQSAEERAATLTQSMDCEVGLLQKQRDSVSAINLEACKKMDAIRKNSHGDAKLLNKEGAEVDRQRDPEA